MVGDWRYYRWMGLEYENKFHLEAIKVVESRERLTSVRLGTRMKSMGVNQGSMPQVQVKRVDLGIENRVPPISGWVQPP